MQSKFLSKYNSLVPYIRRHWSTLIYFLNVRKASNILAALMERSQKKAVCRSRPFMFRLDPCTLCNLQCPGCGGGGLWYSSESGKHQMEFNVFATIIDKIRNSALRVSLYNLGEPLMNTDIYRMCAYAHEKGISTLISTNLTLFKAEDVQDLIGSNLTVLEPCLDGFTQETYSQYRVGGNVEVVKSGIRNVMDHKLKNSLRWPFVDVQVILFDHVRDELDRITDFLKGCRVDQITFRQDIGKIGLEEKGTASQHACHWLYTGMIIMTDGEVYPCCVKMTMPYGNILNQNLADIWNNKFYRFSRALFQHGDDLPWDEDLARIPCLTCGYYQRSRGLAARR